MSNFNLTKLNNTLLAAHDQAAIDSSKVYELVNLYHEAYLLNLDDNITAAYFFLTNAYVYALETDHPQCDVLEGLLSDAGRL